MTSDSWPFADPKNVAVFTTTQVVHDGRPVLYVSHDLDDGAWQFHSGDETVSTQDAMVVALSEMIEIDPSLAELHDLPLGWVARRATKIAVWIREPRVNVDEHITLIKELRLVQSALCARNIPQIRALFLENSQPGDVIRVLDNYPATFIDPPEGFFSTLSIVHLSESITENLKVSIDMPLWSQEEGRSDLEVQLFAIQQNAGWRIEAFDLRVL